MADFLTAAEAARRLGVKPATLYAYVSRGVLTRARAADGRASLFSADEVDRLARKGRPRRPAGTLEITVDPRATVLLGLVRRAAPKSGQLAVAEAVLAEVRQKSLPEPNIDFALATLAQVAGMVRGAGEAIFAVSRTAGWVAHALEAYSGPGPLRPRAVYTGRPATRL